MSYRRAELPILEYDDEPIAVFRPNRQEGYSFPQASLLFLFLPDEIIGGYAKKNSCPTVGCFETVTKKFPIYEKREGEKQILFTQAPLGAPAATQYLDFFIETGVKKVLAVGCCGVLREIPENLFLIPTEAVRDEGTSFQYLPAGESVKIGEKTVKTIEETMDALKIPYSECKTWTTDAFFRETKERVKRRLEMGCSTVEMECSAMAACAEFRKVEFGQVLFTADSLANLDGYDTRGWGIGSQERAIELGFAIVGKL